MAAKTRGRKWEAVLSSRAVRASGESFAATGNITNRAYRIPPIRVTADAMCTQRMTAVRISPILVSILAL